MSSRVFSDGLVADIGGVLPLDHAPGIPSYVTQPTYVAGNVEFSAKLNPNDFDGTPLTGSDEFWVMGAFRNSDGSSLIETLSGQQCLDQGLVMQTVSVTPAMAVPPGVDIPISFAKAPAPDGAIFQTKIFTSDNNGP